MLVVGCFEVTYISREVYVRLLHRVSWVVLAEKFKSPAMLWVFGIDVMAVSLPTLHFPECRIAAVQQVYTVSSTKLYFASRR